MAKLLRYREYDPRWKDEFNRLRDYLDHLLHPFIIDIVHMGSTSVEGLGGKPIVDLTIIFEDHLETIIQILVQHGWVYEGEKGIPDRHAFRRDDDAFYEHHLYVSLQGSLNLVRTLQFKHALQQSATARQAYQALKQTLVKQNNWDRELYTESKTDLIHSIIEEDLQMKSIVFAGGCFWGVEAYFKQLEGVTDTEVGYINGPGETSYKAVCAGSGHAEAVLIKYDEDIISIKKLLDHLFNIIDPTSINKQGPDTGIQYRTGIYNYPQEQYLFITNYLNVRQKEYTRPLQLELETDLTFYPAEDYHQDYLDKNKNGYCHVDLSSYTKIN